MRMRVTGDAARKILETNMKRFTAVTNKGYWIVGISLSRHLHNSNNCIVFTVDLGVLSLGIWFGKP